MKPEMNGTLEIQPLDCKNRLHGIEHRWMHNEEAIAMEKLLTRQRIMYSHILYMEEQAQKLGDEMAMLDARVRTYLAQLRLQYREYNELMEQMVKVKNGKTTATTVNISYAERETPA